MSLTDGRSKLLQLFTDNMTMLNKSNIQEQKTIKTYQYYRLPAYKPKELKVQQNHQENAAIISTQEERDNSCLLLPLLFLKTVIDPLDRCSK